MKKADYYRIASKAAALDISVEKARQLINRKQNRKRKQKNHPKPKIVAISYGRLKKWRKAVLLRDNYICQGCGLTESLHVHHKQWKIDRPDLRYDVDNGITLCEHCHDRIHDGLVSYYKQQTWLKNVANGNA